ncbi:DUF362 domain-containing protein [Candidatus Woesearchaeota archaeon]|nr:DUF362 domain-containing protein [Candidatus Woesearchaeota archaeon]
MSSDVYFIKDNFEENIPKILKKLCPDFSTVGVKVHFGEAGNVTFVPAKYVKIIADCFNSTLIETNVLYKGKRTETKDHVELAKKHGFDFCPIKILDEEEEIPINLKHFKKAILGKIPFKDLVVVSHFKGHGIGFGGAIKNVGMGLASRKGKLALHAGISPSVDVEKCVVCGQCIKECPAEAIKVEEKAKIKSEICIGCAKCIAICPQGAVKIPWNSLGPKEVQERIAEYSVAALKDRRTVYVNFLVNLVKGCDCVGKEMKILGKDIGVLISKDIVAIDKASDDLCKKQGIDFGKINETDSLVQIRYAEKLGLGKIDYKLVEI